jgi:hypothetical protein
MIVDPKHTAPKAAAVAPKATVAASDAPPPEPKKTKTELDAEKAAEDSAKKLGPAQDKAGRINANLAKDGNPHIVQPQVRNGEVRYQFGNFVPTRLMTDEEQDAAEKVKA